MTRTTLFMLCCLTTLGAGLTGCSWHSEPALVVSEAIVSEETDTAVVLRFTIEAENVNDVELPLKRARYVVLLNGDRVFTGDRSPEATLPREGSHQLVLPASIARDAFAGLEPPIRYELKGTLTYTAPGEIAELLFDTGVRVPTMNFRRTGELALD